jgi:ABC-type sugar transport system ATPase subunit
VRPGRVLLLDEPTAVLSEADAAPLLERLVAFRDEGRAIIYVTHRLSEVMQVADRVTVLRDGRNVGTFPRAQVDKERLIDLMAKPGASPPAPAPAPARARRAAVHGPPVLEVRGLTRAGAFADVGLTVAPGQIIGIAGVQGSGHGPLLHAIAGALRADAGSVAIAGEAVAAGSLAQAYRRGALLVPADRRRAAMVAPQSVRANIVLSRRVRASCRRLGLRWPRRERQVAREYVEAFAVKARGTETAAGTLSGGNQQKVALARALESDPRVLLVEEPTQGIDVNAKREIRRLLERLAHEDGRAVVIATSEFEELLGLADVVHVMRLGRLAATLPGPDASYREILSHALP